MGIIIYGDGMNSDTAFGDTIIEDTQTQPLERAGQMIHNIGGSDMAYEGSTWGVIDIRSQTEIHTEASGGGGHVTGMGGFVSGHISPVKVKTTSVTYHTYYLQNEHGRRMHFSRVDKEVDVVVGDKLFVVTAVKTDKAKGFHIPMVYIPAYDRWEIWKDETLAIVDKSKLGKITNIVIWALSILVGAFCYMGMIASAPKTMPGMAYLITGPMVALLGFALTFLVFYGLSRIFLAPVHMKLKSQLKKMQSHLLL